MKVSPALRLIWGLASRAAAGWQQQDGSTRTTAPGRQHQYDSTRMTGWQHQDDRTTAPGWQLQLSSGQKMLTMTSSASSYGNACSGRQMHPAGSWFAQCPLTFSESDSTLRFRAPWQRVPRLS